MAPTELFNKLKETYFGHEGTLPNPLVENCPLALVLKLVFRRPRSLHFTHPPLDHLLQYLIRITRIL